MSDLDDLAETGRTTRERLVGPQDAARGPSEDLIPGIGHYSDMANWGLIWSRPGLDLKHRSLCTLVALLALEHYEYAKVHVRGARHVGWTRDELSEMAFQLTFYVGLPGVHKALALINEAFGDD